MLPPRVAHAETPRAATALTLQIVVITVAGLYFGREVLLPFTLAVLLSFVLAPLTNFLRRALPRVPAVVLAVLLALGVVLGLGGLIGTQIADLVPNVPQYAAGVQTKLSSVQSFAAGHLSELTSRFDNAPETPAAPPAKAAADGTKPPLAVEVHQPGPTPLQTVERILDPLASPLATAAVVFIFTVFILLQREDLRDRLIRLIGSGDLHRTTVAMDDAGRRLSKYFLAQAGLNLSFGIVIGLGLWMLGLPSPLLWGVLSAMLRFVPYLGPVLAAGLPIALAAGVSPGWALVAWTAGLFAVVETLTGQILEPLVYGHSTGLSPFAVVVAATFWTWLWGPIGLLISTPLTLCLVVLGRHVKQLEFLDVLLGDRPALTPVESFYQRMLAGDPDEARDQAEALLRHLSLSAYYDEVVVPGLRLATADLGRGVLGAAQMDRVKATVGELVEELRERDDVEPPTKADEPDALLPPTPAEAALLAPHPTPGQAPPEASLPWCKPTAIMCLAGRFPLDETAATMLAQILRKHGLGACVVSHEQAARGRIGTLDVSDTAMVCVSYLEIGGAPSHLRYLLERLRTRLPRTPILVGLWTGEPADEATRRAVRAGLHARTIHDAVEACLAEARKTATPAA